MEIRPVHGTGSSREKRFFVDFREQWSTLFGACNWNDFTVIRIEGELERYLGSIEVDLALLGFGVTLTYVYDPAPRSALGDFADEVKATISGKTGCEVQDPLNVLGDMGKS